MRSYTQRESASGWDYRRSGGLRTRTGVKHMTKPFTAIPKIIVEGRKGGSNLAATLVNAVLCYNDAEQLRPGRDV